ncbi:PBP1A family penicillin-binding protein [Rhodovarius crocodyli]|uniref:PBP1A family penicillin-binding protein n=2 Tax=Rhodovarius crocodyli TaxID=1979269 RepID=A0A437MPZ0_9PROT|nr:PBP1A family penicillin-binding protein [Rhodovarius crocodyli]
MWWLRMSVMGLIWGAAFFAAVLLWFTHDMPRPDQALNHSRRPAAAILANDGSLLATQGDMFGEVLRLRDMPAFLPAALLSIEDRRFREHVGLDPFGVARAVYANLTAGDVVQGGSTLTQQLAKNLFLSAERSTRRKVQEALLALWLEHRFSKDQLLEIYLNRVYLGGGAYGMDAAARLFFGVSARRVTIWQAAMLAGLPQAPSRTNPRTNPEAAMQRATEVLRAMVETGAITDAQRTQAIAEMRLPTRPGSGGGWFADWVMETVATRMPQLTDVMVRATLDPRWQSAAETRLRALIEREGDRANVAQGAVVVLDANSGAVRAMVGGRDYRRSPFNRVTDARRQPGSSFKPVYYLAALERGASPGSTVSDAPLRRGGWSPGNGRYRSRGEITLEDALAASVNTAAVRVMDLAGGPQGARAMATRLGIQARWPANGSLALGTGELTLLELAGAYAPMVNGGRRVVPHGIRQVVSDGRTQPYAPPAPEQVVGGESAAGMRRMLQAVVARGSGRAANFPGLVIGGKTGTTQDFKDAWFIGFLGSGENTVIIGIWLGNDHGEPMEEVMGGTLPARLFREIVEATR